MRNMNVPVPSLAEQNQLVEAIRAEEAKMASADLIILEAPARKKSILETYL